MCELPEEALSTSEDVPSPAAAQDVSTPAAAPIVTADAMSPRDYLTFVGYIGGFMAFFYGIAFVFAPDSLAK